MSATITLATATRVLRQLRGDRRTLVLLLIVPSLLMVLLRYVFDSSPQLFQRIGLPLLGLFPFTSMFLVTSVAMLRERTSGTLERLLTTPLAKLDLLAGYALAFALSALVQVAVTATVALVWLGLLAPAGLGWVLLLAVASALLGMALGLLVSAFASTEFQAVQFLPAVVLPQLLLSGLLAPRERMLGLLHGISAALPMTYAVDGMSRVQATRVDSSLGWDLGVLAACVIGALALAAATLRRRTG